MNKGHGSYPALRIFQDISIFFIRDFGGLKPEQTDDDLHVVLDPVVDFTQEDFFLFERRFYLGLRLFALFCSRICRLMLRFVKTSPLSPSNHMTPSAIT